MARSLRSAAVAPPIPRAAPAEGAGKSAGEGDAVMVGPSTIAGAGNGAFATRDIRRGEVLGVYAGEALSTAEYDARYPSGVAPYVLDIGDAWVDAADPRTSNWTRFINSPHGTRRRHNVAFSRGGAVVATQRIRRGAELLVSYGRLYAWPSA